MTGRTCKKLTTYAFILVGDVERRAAKKLMEPSVIFGGKCVVGVGGGDGPLWRYSSHLGGGELAFLKRASRNRFAPNRRRLRTFGVSYPRRFLLAI